MHLPNGVITIPMLAVDYIVTNALYIYIATFAGYKHTITVNGWTGGAQQPEEEYTITVKQLP